MGVFGFKYLYRGKTMEGAVVMSCEHIDRQSVYSVTGGLTRPVLLEIETRQWCAVSITNQVIVVWCKDCFCRLGEIHGRRHALGRALRDRALQNPEMN